MKRVIKKILPIFLFALFSFVGVERSHASTVGLNAVVIFDQSAKDLYEDIIQLKHQDMERRLYAYEIEHPQNLVASYLRGYYHFLTCFIQEDPKLYRSFGKLMDMNIKVLEGLSLSDPMRRFIIAELKLMWSVVHLKFDERIKAGYQIYGAYKLLDENIRLFPSFSLSKKSYCIILALSESLPSWAQNLVGIKASSQEAQAMIESLIEMPASQKLIFEKELLVVGMYLYYHQFSQKANARKLGAQLLELGPNNPIIVFLVANIMQRDGENERAIGLLSSVSSSRMDGLFPSLNFVLGKYKLHRMDADAIRCFEKFLLHTKGQNYRKESLQKLAWAHLIIRNDSKAYKSYMQRVINEGTSITDEDKQALKEAKSGVIPKRELLKARLLCDGAYYLEAKKVLSVFDPKGLIQSDKIAYHYRMGKIAQGLKNSKEALSWYQVCIADGKNTRNYMISGAMLQCGGIYEELGHFSEARLWYQRCLDSDPDSYKNGLHQKAKSGLLRIQRR